MRSIGQQIIDEIIEQRLFHADPDGVVRWSSGAAEQLDAIIERRMGVQTEILHNAQEALSSALETGESPKLYVTAHAVRDNLRNVLAVLGQAKARG